MITGDELRIALYEMGVKDVENVDLLIQKICGGKKNEAFVKKGSLLNSYITYSEFLAATLEPKIYLNLPRL